MCVSTYCSVAGQRIGGREAAVVYRHGHRVELVLPLQQNANITPGQSYREPQISSGSIRCKREERLFIASSVKRLKQHTVRMFERLQLHLTLSVSELATIHLSVHLCFAFSQTLAILWEASDPYCSATVWSIPSPLWSSLCHPACSEKKQTVEDKSIVTLLSRAKLIF